MQNKCKKRECPTTMLTYPVEQLRQLGTQDVPHSTCAVVLQGTCAVVLLVLWCCVHLVLVEPDVVKELVDAIVDIILTYGPDSVAAIRARTFRHGGGGLPSMEARGAAGEAAKHGGAGGCRRGCQAWGPMLP